MTTSPTHTPDPPERRLVDSAELRTMLPVGRTTFYKAIAKPDFPTPIQLIDGGDFVWYFDEVLAYLETRRRHPGAKQSTEAPKEERVLIESRGRQRSDAVTDAPLVLRPVKGNRSAA